MGTNFYWLEKDACTHCDRRATEGAHIGKRSAAGMFCWDCDETLCNGGKMAVHYGVSGWSTTCRKCGAAPVANEGLKAGPAAVELGFAPPRDERPKGVRGTSSFSWEIQPGEVRSICEAKLNDRCVVDEYGHVSTGGEFLRMLRANCGIEFTGSIGTDFC
jgi:hypothetical protein